jgi:alkylated DNA repair dioxygenase AlkB
MIQLNIFDNVATGNKLPKHLLDYRPGLFTADESSHFLEKFIKELRWTQSTRQFYGKPVVTPRLTAFYGDAKAILSPVDQLKNPLPWTPELMIIKARVEPLAGTPFNSVLLNYYRDGDDSVSWHSDNDGIPGRNRVVASVSFGEPRKFDIRNTMDHAQRFSVLLENGSYLLMHGDFQDQWEHRIAKSKKAMGSRVNLTFRKL